MDPPADYDTIVADIARADAASGDDRIQTESIIKCMRYLGANCPQRHFFCDRFMYPAACRYLVVFSFPGKKNDEINRITQLMVDSLETCEECIRGLYNALLELKIKFLTLKGVGIPALEQFLDLVHQWQVLRLEQKVDTTVFALREALYGPRLLRGNPQLREKVAARLGDVPHFDSLVPGHLFYLFEGTETERSWALANMAKLRDSGYKFANASDGVVAAEFAHHLYLIQADDFFTPERCTRFWEVTHAVVPFHTPATFALLNEPCDIKFMSEYRQINYFTLVRVLFNNVMASQDAPNIAIIDSFHAMLRCLGPDFWTVARPFVFSNFLDPIIRNPHYARQLPTVSKEHLEWANALVDSLGDAQKLPVRVRAAVCFLAAPVTPARVDAASALLLDSFNFDESQYREAAFSVEILKRRDARAAVDNAADTLINNTRLICRCIAYDMASLAHNSHILKGGKVPTSFDAFPLLWQALLKTPLYSDSSFMREVFAALRLTSSVVKFVPKKTEPSKSEAAALAKHNENVDLVLKLVSGILDKASLAAGDELKSILVNDVAQSFWLGVFSPTLNQAALDVLYQVFDAEGRYEAIYGVLSYGLSPTLTAIVANLDSLTQASVFEPCPKAIRICMDIFNALCNPLNGLLVSRSVPEVSRLWDSTWYFLIMVYERTLHWAGSYHLSQLIEFTRDTLDLSHLLLDSFRLISELSQAHGLFDSFMKAFHHVIVWLKLGDPSLLKSCVDLVFKGFDLATELDFSIDKKFITTFVKFGTRARGYNNKLTEQQRRDIISKASKFDAALVDEVVAESVKSKQKVDQEASFKYQTHQKPVRQQTLTRFGVVTSEPPVAPPPLKIKSSNLDSIRKELKSTRSPKPLAEPAPPRPAGFNKPPVVGRSLNQTKRKRTDSDSSDDDEDVDVSDLFVEKKKKIKVVEVDIHGRPVAAKVAQAKKMSQQRRDEENMRLRLNVNLKPLYTTILKWNYNSTGQYPTADTSLYKPTKELYEDYRDYVKVTEPLLMLECWQGIQSAKLTQQEQPFELLIGSRASCDGFFDVYASIKKTDLSDRKIGDSDLLVLGHLDGPMTSAAETSRYLKAPNSQTCLARVREIKSANADYSDITLRVFPQGSMMGVLTPKSVIVCMKVMQMVTIEREYSSLKGLQYYDLGEAILQAKPSKAPEISDADTRLMLKVHNVNESQARAILGSYNTEGFSLIQGPPGTGKTKTILGIVGYTLSQLAKAGVIETPVDGTRSATPEEKTGPKVLICAPSNAAVDELVLRLKDGVRNSKGESFVPHVVRLGRSDAVNAAVRDVTLEELLDKQTQNRTQQTAIDPNIRTEHTKCISLRDEYRKKLSLGNLSESEVTEIETKLRDVNKKRNELAKKLDEQRENASIAYRTREIERRQLQAKILTNAQVICSTLSGSAHDFLASLLMKFDQVIIDEACQCVELSAIIPLRYGCKKCIMVGDPNQLPPTVLSQAAASFNYEQSLFVRMMNNLPESVHLLDVQYRMHPAISQFPSASFYDSKLKDGERMAELNERPWHAEFPLTPYRFFNIVGRHQVNNLSRSLYNMLEALVVLEMVEHLMKILPDRKFRGRVGVISPYKEQIRTLQTVFRKKYGQTILDEIDFNTVDGFQGQEKEIIIMSCVRASETGNVGFLSDVRRMNVALTRARTSLWILGNAESLLRNKVWKLLLEDARRRDCVTDAAPGFLRRLAGKTVSKTTTNDEKAPAPTPKIESLKTEVEEVPIPTDENAKPKETPEEKKKRKDKHKKDRSDKKKHKKPYIHPGPSVPGPAPLPPAPSAPPSMPSEGPKSLPRRPKQPSLFIQRKPGPRRP